MVHVVWRGLIVSVSFIVGLPEPKTRDVEHTVRASAIYNH